jgi:biotin operon repressor
MADEQGDFQALLTFFKAMSNESRLKIVALLADQEMTVGELAQRLELKEPTVSEHLAQLREAGLVIMRAEGNFRIYSFNAGRLHEMSKTLFNQEQLAALVDIAEDDQAVINNYLKDGRLTTIPASRKKLLPVLRWLADHFEYDRRYTEKEVNAIITQYHEDYATLRREMIGYGLLARERSVYWRV